jgi:hypothetical protein
MDRRSYTGAAEGSIGHDGPDSVRHRTVRDYSKVMNERKRPLAPAWAGMPLEIWGRPRRGITPEINAV